VSTENKIDFKPRTSITELAQKLIDAGCVTNVVGCSEEDIAGLEKRNNIKLASTYKEFLRVMGRRADGHWGWVGSWEYSSLSWMKQRAAHCYVDERDLFFRDVVEKRMGVPPSLPKTAHIFMYNLPDFYMFFDTADGDDPPCYRVYEYAPFERQFESFSAFFTDSVRKQLAQREKNNVEHYSTGTGSSDSTAATTDTENTGDSSGATGDGVRVIAMFSETRPRKAMTFNGAPVKVTWAYENQVERWANVLHDSLLYQLKEYGVISSDHVAGCSNEDIASLNEQFNVELPIAYQTFLTHMGKGADVWLSDCQWRFDELGRVRQTAVDMVAQAKEKHASPGSSIGSSPDTSSQFELAPTDFVFLARQSDLFLYFDTTQEDLDPPVYRFWAGAKAPVLAADSFSKWLKAYESDGHRLCLQLSYIWHRLDTQSTELRHLIREGRPVESSTASHMPPEGSSNVARRTIRFMLIAGTLIIGAFAMLAVLSGKALPNVFEEVSKSVLLASGVIMLISVWAGLALARENIPSDEDDDLRFGLRRKHGYTQTKASATATVDGITVSYMGEDKVGTTLQFVWKPNSDAVIEGNDLKVRLNGISGSHTLSLPREHLAEWEGEWIRTVQRYRTSEQRGGYEMAVTPSHWSVSTLWTSADLPPTHRSGVAFETWRSKIVRPLSARVFVIGLLTFLFGVIAGPIFAGNGLFSWGQFPGGWFAIVPMVLIGAWIGGYFAVRSRSGHAPPIKCHTDFADDRIRFKAWAQTGAYMDSIITWDWGWQLHIREKAVRLFSPSHYFVILVSNEAVPLGKLLLIKEQVVKYGGTVHEERR
jgi:hypothetical protein